MLEVNLLRKFKINYTNVKTNKKFHITISQLKSFLNSKKIKKFI